MSALDITSILGVRIQFDHDELDICKPRIITAKFKVEHRWSEKMRSLYAEDEVQVDISACRLV